MKHGVDMDLHRPFLCQGFASSRPSPSPGLKCPKIDLFSTSPRASRVSAKITEAIQSRTNKYFVVYPVSRLLWSEFAHGWKRTELAPIPSVKNTTTSIYASHVVFSARPPSGTKRILPAKTIAVGLVATTDASTIALFVIL